jgi:predicted secreted protein
VIHCVLNQNARDPGAASHRGMNTDIVDLFAAHGVGVLQMPCPEQSCLGLLRTRPKGYSIRDMLEMPVCQKAVSRLSAFAAEQIREHIENDCEVLAIVGGDVESPGCAVHLLDGEPLTEGLLGEASGVFMRTLEGELRLRGLHVPFLAMRESSPSGYQEDIARLEQLLGEGVQRTRNDGIVE